MGRIKTTLIKRNTVKLLELHGDEFKESFEENKAIVSQFSKIESKKIRNTIAGYVTRLVKKKKAE